MASKEATQELSRRQRARIRAKLEGGTPSLRGTLIKILLLALVDAGVFFAAMLLIAAGQVVYTVVLVATALIINFIYLRRGGLPAKYLAPGVLLLLCFSVSVVFYSGYISFTNYGALHNGSQQEAIVATKLGAIVPDENAPYLEVTLVKDANNKVEFLATDANDPTKPHYYLGGNDSADKWHEITDVANVEIGTSEVSGSDIAVGYPGVTKLSASEIEKSQASLSDLKVFVEPGNEEAGFMALDPAFQGVQLTHFDAIYNAKSDTFTRVSDGTVFKADQKVGFYRSESGEQLTDIGWRVEIGTANYAKIFGDESLRGPLLKIFSWTIIFAATSVLSTFILGMALAFLFNDERIRFRKIYRAIMILPYAFPAFLSAYVWRGMFNTESGFINNSILHLDKNHLIPWLTEEGPARWAVLLCNLWLGFPYMFLITTGALQAIPAELTESAKMDGATPWQQFRLIKLPLLLISLAPLLISSFAFNFNNFTIIYLITGGGPTGDASLKVDAGGTDILISFVYKIAFSSGVGADYGLASAFSVLIFIVIGGLSAISFRRTKFLEEMN